MDSALPAVTPERLAPLDAKGTLELDCYNALSLLGVTGYFVQAQYKHYSGLKANAKVDNSNRTVHFIFSDGYAAAPDDARIGLALALSRKIFRRAYLPAAAATYLEAYKRFSKSASSAHLDHSLSRLHGNDVAIQPQGQYYHLQDMIEDLFVRYHDVFSGVPRPRITWSQEPSRRRLGFHDPGKNRIVITKLLDNIRVPKFVVESVVFHELLHEKHGVLYERGHSMRRTVHPKTFKDDEKKYKDYFIAEEWLKRELRYIR